ncbi:MAG TPA: ATP-binding protein [Gemmatimonadaceae bacterium]|nr:ATP-binding protein [Gemmatimonadaceae bacterium]
MTAEPAEGLTSLTARRLRPSRQRSIDVDPIVGKDILELLSSAMYVDPRTVYREYIQNAADAIDDAFAAGQLTESSLGRVDVWLDGQNRNVRIRDNGTGLRASDAERILTSFGASPKREKDARGFRGVGRLSALGYAQAVSFKTKAAGESQSTEVRWDCRRLKSALLDPTYKGDLRKLVRDVVTILVDDEADEALHYFEVTLEKVVRIKNDLLLNPQEIAQYLGEVAPAPFRKDFPFASSILEQLRIHVPPCRFEVFLNSAKEPITRPHSEEFALSKTKTDTPTSFQIIEFPDGEGGLRAIGWLLHHSYLGAIHAAGDLRGLRARVGNIQIGTWEVFAEVFPEVRFNSWTIGEIHVLDRRIVPNARRDSFEQSAAYSDLLAQLVPTARDIAKRCRDSSARRNRLRAIEFKEKRIVGLFDVLTQRGLSAWREQRTRREVGALLGEMKKLATSKVLAEMDRARMQKRVASIDGRYRGLKAGDSSSDPLESLTTTRRAAYRDVFDLIYDCSPNKTVAKVLVDRIADRLAGQLVRAGRRRKLNSATPAKSK